MKRKHYIITGLALASVVATVAITRPAQWANTWHTIAEHAENQW